jgi:molybdopterin synthase catalytic subunit
MFELTENPVIPEVVINRLKRDTNGATVTFIGSLRGYSSDGNKVLYAECDSDKKMSEQQLRHVVEVIRTQWQLDDVSICHRVGRIEVGDTILVVVIAAPHRQEAFDACQYAVDRIKESILIREVLEKQ